MLDFRKLTPEEIKTFFADKKAKLYTILFSLIIFSSLYLFIFILPRYAELLQLARGINEINYNIDLVNNRVKRLDEMTNQLKNLASEVEGYSQRLPAEKEIPEFLEELSGIAKSAKIKILSITPLELREAGPAQDKGTFYREMPIQITAKSGYHELGFFLTEIERTKRFITIEDLRIYHDEKNPKRHDIRITLKTYVSIDSEEKKS